MPATFATRRAGPRVPAASTAQPQTSSSDATYSAEPPAASATARTRRGTGSAVSVPLDET
jgi:hypothetical protein